MKRSKECVSGECYFGISDEIVKDSLASLNYVQGEMPIIIGGMAIQLHGYERERILRKTSDLDLLIKNNQKFSDFRKSYYEDIYPFLKNKGYHINAKRGRGNNAAKVTKNMNKEDQQNFLMHWTVFNPNHYDSFIDYIERQIDYSKDFFYPSDDTRLKVASLEEILPLKIRRATNFGTDREELVGPIYPSLIDNAKEGNWGVLASIPLTEMGKGLMRMQKKLEEKAPYTKERFSTYKLSKDIYDLCLSARLISDDRESFDKERYQDNLERLSQYFK